MAILGVSELRNPELIDEKFHTSLRLQVKYSRLFNLGEMSCFNQHNAVQ